MSPWGNNFRLSRFQYRNIVWVCSYCSTKSALNEECDEVSKDENVAGKRGKKWNGLSYKSDPTFHISMSPFPFTNLILFFLFWSLWSLDIIHAPIPSRCLHMFPFGSDLSYMCVFVCACVCNSKGQRVAHKFAVWLWKWIKAD